MDEISTPPPSHPFARAGYILKTQGPFALVKRGARYLVYQKLRFQYLRLELFEDRPWAGKEIDFCPRIENLTCRIIASQAEADAVAREGFEDFRGVDIIVDGRRCIDAGAVAFCLYAGRELAHIGWVATSLTAKNSFDPLPYKVDFSHGQAATGGTYTVPKFRGKGLMGYGKLKRLAWLGEKGCTKSRHAVEKGNNASLAVNAKFHPRLFAHARYLRIGKWSWWREVPVREKTRTAN